MTPNNNATCCTNSLAVLIIFLVVVTVTSQRAIYQLASTELILATTSNGFDIPITARKDLLIYWDRTSSSPTTVIMRRNNAGMYKIVANYSEMSTLLRSTNGKWIAMMPQSPGLAALFAIDENNYQSNTSYINTFGGFLLSDNTFVGVYPLSSLQIRTYEYNNASNNWTNIVGTELNLTTEVSWAGEISTYRVTDTHLVFIDYSKQDYDVKIYQRREDKSWKFLASVPINNTLNPRQGSVTYNDVDTLFYARPTDQLPNGYTGLVFIYTSINGSWIEQTFTAESVGYKPQGLLGGTVIFSDPNTLFVSAGFEDYNFEATYKGGRILMLTRSLNGLWEPTADLVGGKEGLFGLGFSMNDYDIIVPSLNDESGSTMNVVIYSAPRCFYQPINVTCNDLQVTTCSSLATSKLYTINNPQCGAVSASVDALSLLDDQRMQAQISLTKSFGPAAYCNATIACLDKRLAPMANDNVSGSNVIQLRLALAVSTLSSLITLL